MVYSACSAKPCVVFMMQIFKEAHSVGASDFGVNCAVAYATANKYKDTCEFNCTLNRS